MIRRPPRSTQSRSSAASDVYKRQALLKLVGEHTVTVTLEDGIVDGGIGAVVAQRALEHGLHSPVHAIGVPLRFIQHSSRTEILEDLGLRAGDVARDVLAIVARLQTGSD